LFSKPRSEGRPLGRSLRVQFRRVLPFCARGTWPPPNRSSAFPFEEPGGCLTYLAEVHLGRQDVGTVSEMALPNNELASTLGFPRVRGDGDGADGLERRQRSRGRGLARHALENWRATAVVFTSTRSV
jgi:hypothetical protein